MDPIGRIGERMRDTGRPIGKPEGPIGPPATFPEWQPHSSAVAEENRINRSFFFSLLMRPHYFSNRPKRATSNSDLMLENGPQGCSVAAA